MTSNSTCLQAKLKQPNLLRRMYDWCLEAADTKRAQYIMYLMAFAESSFFPLPPDLMLIPMILANRLLAWRLAFWATVSSVVGGMLGYAIGFYLFASFGQWIIDTYQMQSSFDRFQSDFQNYGFWIIALKGLTPIPYKLVTIASGVAKFDFMQFITASIIARAFRFYLLSALLYFFGPIAKQYIERYLTLALLVSLAIILAGFAIVKCIG
ncbi:MAG: YqaA family protein [Alphaproteobacteria bacterium]